MIDTYKRDIQYMRISITDRCNFRCTYCSCGQEYVHHNEILKYEEIYQIVGAAVELGITHFRVTGGEPFMRRDCMRFLQSLVNIPGVESVGITTNGSLLTHEMVNKLADMGISSINISLDTLDAYTFEEITSQSCCAHIKNVINWCLEVELPVKINAVWGYQKDLTDVLSMIALTKDLPVHLRFIEEMPMGNMKCHKENNVEVMHFITEQIHLPYVEVQNQGHGPARYIRIQDYRGCIGFIEPIHQKFCEQCNRIRLTSMGELRMCLYHGDSVDMKSIVRNQILTAEQKHIEIKNAIEAGIRNKPKEHHFCDDASLREMYTIGG